MTIFENLHEYTLTHCRSSHENLDVSDLTVPLSRRSYENQQMKITGIFEIQFHQLVTPAQD